MEGDLVFLKLRPYRQRSFTHEKLAARYYRPFKVLWKIGNVAYKLELPATSTINPVFHVSLLRRAKGSVAFSPTLPRQLNSELELVVEPEQLFEVRSKTQGQVGDLKVLIKWKSLPEY